MPEVLCGESLLLVWKDAGSGFKLGCFLEMLFNKGLVFAAALWEQ